MIGRAEIGCVVSLISYAFYPSLVWCTARAQVRDHLHIYVTAGRIVRKFHVWPGTHLPSTTLGKLWEAEVTSSRASVQTVFLCP